MADLSGSFSGSIEALDYSQLDIYSGSTFGFFLHQRLGTDVERVDVGDFYKTWLESDPIPIYSAPSGGRDPGHYILVRSGSDAIRVTPIKDFFGGYIERIAVTDRHVAHIYAKGAGRGSDTNQPTWGVGVLTINGETVYDYYKGAGRDSGLTLTILSSSNFDVISSTNYNTSLGGNTTNADDLATAIGSMTPQEIGIITSIGYWETFISDGLRSSGSYVGLTKLAGHTSSTSGSAYTAIFTGKSGSNSSKDAIERMITTGPSTGSVDIPQSVLNVRLQSNPQGIYGHTFIDGAYHTNALWAPGGDIETPAMYVTSDGTIVGNYAISGSIDSAVSASYALTASYAANAGGGTPESSSYAETSSYSNTSEWSGLNDIPSGLVSSSGQVDYTGLQNVPVGIVSSSTQVDYTQLQNTPSGLFSSSGQVDYTGLLNIPNGIVSSSTQVDYTGLTNIPTGIVSSSGQVTSLLPIGTVSSSGQVSYNGITDVPIGIVSSSGQVTSLLPVGTVSSSGQVSYNGITDIPSGIVSSSGQVSFTGLTNTPSGLVSSSGQVNYTGLSNVPSGIVSSSTQVKILLPSSTVSSSVFTSPSQGTVRATINGVQTDVDTGLQSTDSPTFYNTTVSNVLTTPAIVGPVGTSFLNNAGFIKNFKLNYRYDAGDVTFWNFQPNAVWNALERGYSGSWSSLAGVTNEANIWYPDMTDHWATLDMSLTTDPLTIELSGSMPVTSAVQTIRTFLQWHGARAYATASFAVKRNDDVWVDVSENTSTSTGASDALIFSDVLHGAAPYPTYTAWRGIRVTLSDKLVSTGLRYIYGMGLYAPRDFFYPYMIYKKGDTMYGSLSFQNTGNDIITPSGYDLNINPGTDIVNLTGSLYLNGNINFGTSDGDIHLSKGSFITFYEDGSSQHAICSRGIDGSEQDDLRINSYGSLFINLDANNNNTDTSDFVIGRHGSSVSTISDILLRVDGETGAITASSDIVPDADNTGNVGTSGLTWNSGYFTNMTIDQTLAVRGAVDLADGDILRLGTSDDWEFFHNGTNNYMDLNVGDLIVRDNTTTRWTFTRSTGEATGTDWVATSDIRLKNVIGPVPYGLETVKKMNPIIYTWKDRSDNQHDLGFSAQEMEELVPEVVRITNDTYGIAYDKLVPVLVQAIKQLSNKIEVLEAKIK